MVSFDPISYSSSIVNKLGKVDTVVCLAGVSSGTQSELCLNTQLAEASLSLAEDLGAKRLFYGSSAAVYGYGEALNEFDTLYPVSDYGQSKIDAEMFQCVGQVFSSCQAITIRFHSDANTFLPQSVLSAK